MFQFFPSQTKDYLLAKKEHNEAKKQRTIALNKVKEFTKGSVEYTTYLKTKKEADLAWNKLNVVKDNDRYFGFTNKQQFFGEFGPWFCFFVYALFNLSRSFYFERKNIGMKVLHGLIISGTIFYFFWMFQQFQDFSKFMYYFMTLISAAVVVHAVLLFTKYREHRINRLKRKQLELSKFTFLNTKPEKKKEMLDLLSDSNED